MCWHFYYSNQLVEYRLFSTSIGLCWTRSCRYCTYVSAHRSYVSQDRDVLTQFRSNHTKIIRQQVETLKNPLDQVVKDGYLLFTEFRKIFCDKKLPDFHRLGFHLSEDDLLVKSQDRQDVASCLRIFCERTAVCFEKYFPKNQAKQALAKLVSCSPLFFESNKVEG